MRVSYNISANAKEDVSIAMRKEKNAVGNFTNILPPLSLLAFH